MLLSRKASATNFAEERKKKEKPNLSVRMSRPSRLERISAVDALHCLEERK